MLSRWYALVEELDYGYGSRDLLGIWSIQTCVRRGRHAIIVAFTRAVLPKSLVGN